MEITAITTRPSALAVACAPVSVVAHRSLPSVRVRDLVAGLPAVWGPVAADAPQLQQVHQVQAQAEMGPALVRAGESYGINGSTVKGVEMAAKRLFDGARGGVPPRGRPV